MTQVLRADLVALSHLNLDETWLQARLALEPALLGLGRDVVVIQRERRQPRAGRLDLLLENADGDVRFEVELMLGSLDESHIIRTIEYWDIERRRYPAYDHVAVVVAEDITSRFLNVLSLFSGTIPLVALQLNVLRLPEGIVLHFSKVLDQRALRADDTVTSSQQSADRPAWVRSAGDTAMRLVDDLLKTINEIAKPRHYELTFMQQYIGMKTGERVSNFVLFKPRQSKLLIEARVLDVEQVRSMLEAVGVTAKAKGEDRIDATISLNPGAEALGGLKELMKAAVTYQNT